MPALEKKRKMSLLLVDHEEGFTEILAKRMERRSIVVTKATTACQAIQALRKRDFDVAIVDLKLDDMDGLELLRIFKAMLEEMPVIMLTGHGSHQASRESLALGAFAYLNKPCELDDLIHVIDRAVLQGGEPSESVENSLG
jgi:DNA-binding NtrC family response regulator